MSCTERVVVLVDMDCFYCQVEEKLDPSLKGKPIAVVQYNAWRGGGIIAVNYPAREKGVTRHMRGDDAKQKCPEIVLARVPEVRGKADLTKYREAGKKVAEVLLTFTPTLERASVDEAYLDITDVVKKRIVTDFGEVHFNNLQNSYVVGYDIQDFLYNVHNNGDYSESNCKLAMGALIAEEIRAEVYKKTGYKCSAGIAHNKMLAKVVCGLHKPNKQTILPQECVPKLYKNLPIKKVPGFGGKFGNNLSEQLNISKLGELITYSEKQLIKQFDEKTGKWLYNIARGIDYEPVTTRLISKSIGCCKNFPGRTALTNLENVEHWVSELISELSERLDKDVKENNRRAKQITLHFSQTVNDKDVSNSKTLSLSSYDQSKITQICLDSIKKYCVKSDGTCNIKYLGFSVGNFELNKKIGNISNFFENMRNFQLQKNVVFEENINKLDSSEQNILENNKLSSYILMETRDANPEQQNQLFAKRELLNENNISTSEKQCTSVIENKIDNQENTSIYSAETDDLNEDMKSLIYYEDIYPEDIATKPIFNKSLCVSYNNLGNEYATDDSILKSSYHNNLFTLGESSSSFFSNYFENCSTNDTCDSSRNFDTSKNLVEESSDEIKSDESVHITQDNEGDIKTYAEFKEQERTVLGSDTCPECQKNITKSEFGSHMDYHYALNIVRKEAHLYKSTKSSTTKELSVKDQFFHSQSNSTKKRKAGTNPIHTYLQVDDLNEDNSELCSECNKRIRLDDIISHMDYHTAKKLHLEINARSSFVSNKNNNNEKLSIKTKKKSVKNTGNIFSFFK